MSLRPEAAQVNEAHGPHGVLGTIASARAAEKAWSLGAPPVREADVGAGVAPHPAMPKGYNAAQRMAWELRNADMLERERKEKDERLKREANARAVAATKRRMAEAVNSVKAERAKREFDDRMGAPRSTRERSTPANQKPVPILSSDNKPSVPAPAPRTGGKAPIQEPGSSSDGSTVEGVQAEIARLKKELEARDAIIQTLRAELQTCKEHLHTCNKEEVKDDAELARQLGQEEAEKHEMYLRDKELARRLAEMK